MIKQILAIWLIIGFYSLNIFADEFSRSESTVDYLRIQELKHEIKLTEDLLHELNFNRIGTHSTIDQSALARYERTRESAQLATRLQNLRLEFKLLTKRKVYSHCSQFPSQLEQWVTTDIGTITSLGLVESNEDLEFTRWRRRQDLDQPVKAIAMVVQGLNLKSEAMRVISDPFNEMGIDVVQVALPGLRGAFWEAVQIEREDYFRELLASYCFAEKEANQANVPIVYAGISSGAMILHDFIQTKSNPYLGNRIDFDRAILFAPAFDVHPRFQGIIDLIQLMPRQIFGWVPTNPSSTIHTELRVYQEAPVSLYKVLRESLRSIQKSKIIQSPIKSLVYVDNDDELIDVNLVKQLAAENSNWSLQEINVLPGIPHHNIMSEYFLGKELWDSMLRQMYDHIFTDD